MIASIAFIILARQRPRTLFALATTSLILLVAFVYAQAIFDGTGQLQPNVGTTSWNILGGFPRVFYGFTCGMLLCILRIDHKIISGRSRDIGPLALYAALLGVLLFPHSVRGLFQVSFIAIVAPALVFVGANYNPRTKLLTSVSEFLGWLSYPLYCLHAPIFYLLRALNERANFSQSFGVSYREIGVCLTIVAAICIAATMDTLGIQPRFARLIDKGFASFA
jgi:peptidoglycan/LPS O-acetylase OafA/YrhL